VTRLSAVDRNGRTFSAGSRVRAWWDGYEYTGTVEEVLPHVPGEGYFQPVVITRDGDGARMESTSDAVEAVSRPAGGPA
jgi:hypothetical protein